MNDFKLTIHKPCAENWNKFNPTSSGGFCGSCQKNVVDFTKMSETEIIDFFEKKPMHTCGRFTPSQLTTYSTKVQLPPQKRYNWLKAGFLSLLLLGGGKELMAQQKSLETKIEKIEKNNFPNQLEKKLDTDNGITVEGTITSNEDGEPLPGVAVLIKGTSFGTQADIDGKFKLENLKEGDVLVFSYIGFMQKEVKVTTKNDNEFVMNMELELVCDIMGEVAVEGLYEGKKQSGISKLFASITQAFK